MKLREWNKIIVNVKLEGTTTTIEAIINNNVFAPFNCAPENSKNPVP